VYERGPPLFVDPEEIIYHNQSLLCYHVTINMLEVEVWHDPSDSSSLGGDSDLNGLVG
jgi:hypothetical protein